jgi:TolA-binding protein
MHIEELDNRIQQIRTMQDNWQKRHEELDQRALQMDADHQKRLEEFEARVADHMKGVAAEQPEDKAEARAEEVEDVKDADKDEIPHKPKHKQHYHHHSHRSNKDF